MIEKLSVIVSVYNEEAVLAKFFAAVMPVMEGLGTDFELIFCDDGSRDGSPAILDHFAAIDPRVKIVHFSRNYGHEYAMTAGIDYAAGDALICMDADLQHPVTLIPAILAKLNEGYEIVTMVRRRNESAPAWKRFSSAAFYKIMNKMSDMRFEENASDFFALSAAPANIIRNNFRESTRYMRAFVQSIGFRKTSIEYDAEDRAAGESKYNFRKLFRLAMDAFVSFSGLPLRLPDFFSALLGAAGVVLLIILAAARRLGTAARQALPLYAFLCLVFAAVFLVLGIMGKYIAVLLREARRRPLYTVSRLVNFGGPAACRPVIRPASSSGADSRPVITVSSRANSSAGFGSSGAIDAGCGLNTGTEAAGGKR